MQIGRSCAAALATLACLGACASAAERAGRARNEAQAATDAGDLVAARQAMLRAVQAKDDDAGLWIMLGRTQLGLGDIGGAYQSYSRAVELNRTDIEALQAIADLSLAAGRLDDAKRYADQLELLQPGSPGPIATKGFIDLAENRPGPAIGKADAVLAIRPSDPAGSILKARALGATGQLGKAAELLEAQIGRRGPSLPVLTTLLKLYLEVRDTPSLLRTKKQLLALEPNSADRAFDYAEELYRAGDDATARGISVRVAGTDPSLQRLEQLLRLWGAHESREQAVRIAGELAGRADAPRRAALASFLVDQGAPEMAEALLRHQADAPVSASTADAIAVFARARGARGDRAFALERLDAVLRFDPDNGRALRARVDLDLAKACSDRTLANARRLVAQNFASPDDRLRLADCYMLRGNRRLVETTYWTAFQEIPANETLYRSFDAFLKRSGDGRSAALLRKRYQEQQQAVAMAALAKA